MSGASDASDTGGPDGARGTHAGSAADVISRTWAAVGVVVRHRDARLVVVASALAYLAVYLFAVGDLALTGGGDLSVFVVDRPLRRALVPVGYSRFEPIALARVGPATVLFSPLNALLAAALAALVGVNLGLTYLGVVQPRACGLETPTGALAGVPALLSGAACCGPALLFVLGIQATGLLLSAFQLLVPVALVLLVASLLLVGRRLDPELLGA